MDYNIAQINIARLKYPIDDPRIKDFVDNLDKINTLAESFKGFVWRLKDESGNATSISVYDDPLIIVNMSVWESIDDLFHYTYRSDHIDIFRRRGEWFDRDNSHLAIWWNPKENIPTPEEGKRRLEYIEKYGPTPFAFNFKKQYSKEEVIDYKSNS